MRGQEYFGRDAIAMLLKLPDNLTEHFPVAQRKQTGNVLEEKCLGFELFQKPDVVLEELIALVAQESLRGIYRETLTGRTPNENVQRALFKLQPLTDRRWVDIFNILRFGPYLGVVE
jgi:hypothetical protein